MGICCKRGEISSTYIIILVLAIAGFVVMLALIYGLKNSTTSDEDICKLSVLGRATGQGISTGAGQLVPLQCTTKKICLSTKLFGGNCPQFAGEKNVQNVHVSDAEDIEANAAETMYSCWNMMGQGKLDIFGTYASSVGWSTSAPTCVICSRVALADDVDTNIITQINLRDYLSSHNVPGTDKTYLQTFTDSDMQSYPDEKTETEKEAYDNVAKSIHNAIIDISNKLVIINAQISEENAKPEAQRDQAKLKQLEDQKAELVQRASYYPTLIENLNKQYESQSVASKNEIAFVFMQIKTTDFSDALKKQFSILGTAGAVSFVSAPNLFLKVGGLLFNEITGIVAIGAAAIDIGATAINTWTSKEVAAGYCGPLTSKEAGKKGCSIVQSMPYNQKSIASFCWSIQGNP